MVYIDNTPRIITYILRNSFFFPKRKKNEFSFKPKIIPNKIKKIKDLRNKIKLVKLDYIRMSISFIIILIHIIKGCKSLFLSNDSYIKFKTKPTDKIKLFNLIDGNSECRKLILPDIIESDGINYTDIKFNYTINRTKNHEIKLIWEDKPNSTACLFQDCDKYILKFF